MFCQQKEWNEIEIFNIKDKFNGKCKNAHIYCNDVESLDKLPDWVNHYIYRHDYSEYESKSYKKQIKIPWDEQIQVPTKENEFIQGCRTDGTFCTENCGKSFYVCVGGVKMNFVTSEGTLCHQSTPTSIIQVNTADPKCNNIVSEKFGPAEPVVNPINIKCGTLDGYYCEDECGKKKGYYYCQHNKASFYMPIAGK